jgi:predicted cupin superfamily sugar epimerase
MKVEELIKSLNMKPHPEGGYFCETYLSEDALENGHKLFSSILFLLQTGEVSHFHQLEEDELWYFQDGNSLLIYEITPEGKLNKISLGRDVVHGEKYQYLVKKGSIFGSVMKNNGYSLVGCLVSPSFSYEHFKLFTRKELLSLYPEYEEEIKLLTY